VSNKTRLRAPDRMNSRVRLRESATAVAELPTSQAVQIAEATASALMTTEGVRRYRAKLIAGDVQGSTGYYPASMLQQTVEANVFHAGLPIYGDHPSGTEEVERPERSIHDLAGRLVTDAIYESDGLYADIEVYPLFIPLVAPMAESIGMSIRASGTAEYGKQPPGQRGPLITSIVSAESVDFVTAAGAGGKLVSLLESARAAQLVEAQNIEAWFESRIHSDFTSLADDMYGAGKLTRDERITLSNAVGDALKAFTAKLQAEAPQLATRGIYQDPTASTSTTESASLREASTNDTQSALDTALRTAYGDDGDVTQWIYVCDFDPDQNMVWYAVSDNQSRTTWQQSYTLTTGDAATVATLADERVEVVPRTEYVPVPASAQAPADTDGDDDTDTNVTESAPVEIPAVEATPPVADGAPPTVSTQPNGEATMADSPTGTTPDAAGTTDTAVSTAVTEAQTARVAAETKAVESERRATEADAKLARYAAVEASRPIATELLTGSQISTPAARAQVIESVTATLPMTEASVLDEPKFREAMTAAITAKEAEIAEALEAAGVGRVAGLGGTTSTSTASDATVVASLAESYVTGGMSPEAAKLAAAGRP